MRAHCVEATRLMNITVECHTHEVIVIQHSFVEMPLTSFLLVQAHLCAAANVPSSYRRDCLKQEENECLDGKRKYIVSYRKGYSLQVPTEPSTVGFNKALFEAPEINYLVTARLTRQGVVLRVGLNHNSIVWSSWQLNDLMKKGTNFSLTKNDRTVQVVLDRLWDRCQ